MPGINEMIRRLQAINIHDVIGDAIEQTKEQLKVRQQDQMMEGEGKKGKIGRYRNLSYAGRKNLINPRPGFGNVDLRLTGDFQEGIRITVNNDSVHYESSDEKAPALEAKYDEANIYGLNKSNASEYSLQDMGPMATKIIKGKLAKK